MFYEEKLKAKISRYGGETGKRKDKEPENLIVLSFTGTVPNEQLAHISPSMRSRFYVNDDSPDIIGDRGPTKLSMPEIDNKFKVKDKVVGAEVRISYGIGSDVVLSGCDVYAMGGECMEGGQVLFAFKVRTKEAAAKDVGIIHEVLNGNEVEVEIIKPISTQEKLGI